MLTTPDCPEIIFEHSLLPRAYIEEHHQRSWDVALQGIEFVEQTQSDHPAHNVDHSTFVTAQWAIHGLEAVRQKKLRVLHYNNGISAAGTHDGIYDVSLAGTGENEARSIQFASSLMSQYDVFSPQDNLTVRGFLSSSIFKGADENGIHQSAPACNYGAQLFTDIDVCYIGDKWENARVGICNYYREINGKEPDLQDPDFIAFLEFQVSVLSGHQFKTDIIAYAFPHTNDNAEHIKRILDKNL
jgi:hypothetical protein